MAVGRARLGAARPEWWVYGAAGLAGLGLVAAHGRGGGSWPAAWAGWLAMVGAMMLPVVAPTAGVVARRSLWRRRHRSMAWFLAGYLAVWGVAGAALVAVLSSTGHAHPPARAAAVALLAAAAWQVAPARRRVLRRCAGVRLGPPRGWAADRDCAAVGWRAGLRCAVTCGPVMLGAGLAHHHLALMAGLTVLLLTERARGPNPAARAGRPLEAWCLAAFAVVVAAGG